MQSMEKLYIKLPDTPGVYLMKDSRGHILYIGKAGNLHRRVSSYFLKPQDYRISRLISEVRKIDYFKTDTALEALILEAALIKKYQPPFNIREKDDKSFLYVEITKEKFPRVLLVRGKDPVRGKRFGPFVDAGSLREAVRILRRIFPWNTHSSQELENSKLKHGRPCFDYQIGLCPGTCIGAISRTDYLKTMRNIRLLFSGKRNAVIKKLTKEMGQASRALEFEKAAKLKRQIFALEHIRDAALITEDRIASLLDLQTAVHRKVPRIEGYDIAHISGAFAVGSMVVFIGDKPAKDQYRKFRIKTVKGQNDTAMLKEVLERRFKNDWPEPDLILVDGGLAQVNAARRIVMKFEKKIPVLGIAKGPKRKRTDIVGGKLPFKISKRTLILVRDEAHRFATTYHKKLRKEALSSL
jgi:excinuclease ABC subunit C